MLGVQADRQPVGPRGWAAATVTDATPDQPHSARQCWTEFAADRSRRRVPVVEPLMKSWRETRPQSTLPAEY